ncbi:hypothetical protein D3C71_2107060 [compost metagenome]
MESVVMMSSLALEISSGVLRLAIALSCNEVDQWDFQALSSNIEVKELFGLNVGNVVLLKRVKKVIQ